jgi:hypothetical protein
VTGQGRAEPGQCHRAEPVGLGTMPVAWMAAGFLAMVLAPRSLSTWQSRASPRANPEAVTLLADAHVPAQAYHDVAAEFSQEEIAALVSLIVTINAWNAISVSTRAWVPGS